MKDKQVFFSTLWLFVLLNYLYCDIVTLMDSAMLQQFMTGDMGDMRITPEFLFGASILMELPISMILLSRLLKYPANRWANLIAGTIMTVVQTLTLLIGTSTAYYLFFSVIEIGTTAFIVWQAWKWAAPVEVAQPVVRLAD